MLQASYAPAAGSTTQVTHQILIADRSTDQLMDERGQWQKF